MAWPIREVNGLLASLNDMPKKKKEDTIEGPE